MSTTTDTELPSDWWSTADVLAYLKSVGAPISRATWSAYVARGQAPAPDRMFGKSPVWRPKAVKDWQAARPRRGAAPS
jgi:predicted DNA-binding transcriptional regulator AlpA